MRFYDRDTYYAYPDHGYRRAAELEGYIEEGFKALSAKYHVPMPHWSWTAINTHFEPLESYILISDYIVDIWHRRPEYQEDIRRIVSFEVAHEFKHYLDTYRFQSGDPRGRKVIRHIEGKRVFRALLDLRGTIPAFEEDAVMFATTATKMSEFQFNTLYSKIQPWNIPGYTVPL